MQMVQESVKQDVPQDRQKLAVMIALEKTLQPLFVLEITSLYALNHFVFASVITMNQTLQ